MDISVHVVRFDWPGAPATIAATLSRLAVTAEQVGVCGLSLMDHYFQIGYAGSPDDPMLEGYTSLGFLAGRTERIRLGLLVTGVTYRHPGLLAKIVTTLDVLSAGRAELGIGAAWYEGEHDGLGVPFQRVAERFERLEEAVQTCRQMWSENDGPFEGRHYHLASTICSPAPISRPHPRILIGGGGERKTLRLVARYAAACNVFAQSVDSVEHKLDVLRRHCDEVGRDYDEIAKTILYTGNALAARETDHFLAEMAPYARLGVGEVVVVPGGERPDHWVETRLGPVAGELAQL